MALLCCCEFEYCYWRYEFKYIVNNRSTMKRCLYTFSLSSGQILCVIPFSFLFWKFQEGRGRENWGSQKWLCWRVTRPFALPTCIHAYIPDHFWPLKTALFFTSLLIIIHFSVNLHFLPHVSCTVMCMYMRSRSSVSPQYPVFLPDIISVYFTVKCRIPWSRSSISLSILTGYYFSILYYAMCPLAKKVHEIKINTS